MSHDSDTPAASGNAETPLTAREVQRARVLTAMRAALLDRGVEHVTVSQVLADAKIPRGVFYQLFESRDDCVAAVIGQALERASARAAPAMVGHEAWAERVGAALGALLELFDEDPGLARLCLIHSRLQTRATEALRRTALHALVGVIAEGDGRGLAGPRSPGAGSEPVTAEATVAGVLGVVEARLQGWQRGSLVQLVSPLMSFIVRPYRGAGAARKELARPRPAVRARRARRAREVPDGLRVTYRTVRVLGAIAERPGMSNMEVARRADVVDQGQVSKLLKRLAGLGLIENTGGGQAHGQANRWRVRAEGRAFLEAIGVGRTARDRRAA